MGHRAGLRACETHDAARAPAEISRPAPSTVLQAANAPKQSITNAIFFICLSLFLVPPDIRLEPYPVAIRRSAV